MQFERMETIDASGPIESQLVPQATATLPDPFVEICQATITCATGISLFVVLPDGIDPPDSQEVDFCVFGCGQAPRCAACQHARAKRRKAGTNAFDMQQIKCGAGLTVFIRPVSVDKREVATVWTQPLLLQPPSEDEFQRTTASMRALFPDAAAVRRARESYFSTPVCTPTQVAAVLDGMACLLRLREKSRMQARGAATPACSIPRASMLPAMKCARQPESTMFPGNALVFRASHLIDAELAEIAPPELARRLSASHGHLCRVFKRVTGSTLTEYIARARVKKAAELLLGRPPHAITDIVAEVGFQSSSPFYAAFKRWMGVSPTQYRNANLAGHSR